MVLPVSDLERTSCEIRDTIPAHDDQHKMGYLSTKKHLHSRTEEGTFEFERKKKVKKENLETEADSSSCFVSLVTASNLHKDALELPKDFTTSNRLKEECPEIVLTDKGERAWSLDLRFNNSSETFYISRGWRCFCNENSQKPGSFFIFNLVGNGEIPVLSFYTTESRQRAIRRESLSTQLSSSSEEDECSSLEMEKKKNHLRVTLTITPNKFQKCRLRLPLIFTRENGINKPGMIILKGKDSIKHHTKLLLDKGKGSMVLGKGWKYFVKANGLKIGDSFTLKLIWEDATPVLTLCPAEKESKKESLPVEASIGKKISDEEERKKDPLRCRDSPPPSQNRYVTLTPTHDSLRKGRQYLPLPFVIENGMTRPGKITLLGKDGTKWLVNLVRNGEGKMTLGSGWKDFAIANGLKIGEAITLELILENGTPMLSLLSTESTRQKGECSKEPTSGNKTRKAKNNKEERRDDSSLPIQNRFVTLTFTPEDVRECKLDLPSGFMRVNGINKLGEITLLGEKGMEWFGYLLRKDGFMAMGIGWDSFCEANGVKIGESFTLEFISEQGLHNFVLNFSSNSRN